MFWLYLSFELYARCLTKMQSRQITTVKLGRLTFNYKGISVLKCWFKYESTILRKNVSRIWALSVMFACDHTAMKYWFCRHRAEEKWMNVTMVEQWSGIQRNHSTVYVRKDTKERSVKKVLIIILINMKAYIRNLKTSIYPTLQQLRHRSFVTKSF